MLKKVPIMSLMVLGAIALGGLLTLPEASARGWGNNDSKEAQTQTNPQNRAATQNRSTQAVNANSITDERLKAYSVAVTQIEQINQSYQNEYNEARQQNDTEDLQEMREQLPKQVQKVLDSQNMTMQEFEQIQQAVRQNAQLQAKVQSYLQ